MKNIQTEKMKYGIGITADYSSVGLGMRVGEKESIESIPGATECQVDNKELGIANNGLFSHILCEAKDTFQIKLNSTTSSRPSPKASGGITANKDGSLPAGRQVSTTDSFQSSSARDDVLYPLNITATKGTAFVYIKIIVAKNVHATIHEQLFPKDFIGCIIDVVLEEGANVTYIADQRADENTSSIMLRRAFVKERAQMKWIDIAIGGNIANSTIYTSLDGRGAVGETYGLFYGKSELFHDIAHTTIHNAPSTTSKMKTNGALDEKSKAIYRSLIDIREHAVDADGQQKEETLLLSPNAQVSSVPDLEIANNEVVCSHGVATSNVDDESLFYFHSRGLNTDEAKRAIVDGHLGVILDLIEDESIQLRIADSLKKKYE